jgi:hypothetical protein
MTPFLHGKHSGGSSLARAAAPQATGLGSVVRAHAPSAVASAQVEAVKEGDKVVRLVITCSCGERIEVECIYPPGI